MPGFVDGETADGVGVALQEFLGVVAAGVIDDDGGSKRVNGVKSVGVFEMTLWD